MLIDPKFAHVCFRVVKIQMFCISRAGFVRFTFYLYLHSTLPCLNCSCEWVILQFWDFCFLVSVMTHTFYNFFGNIPPPPLPPCHLFPPGYLYELYISCRKIVKLKFLTSKTKSFFQQLCEHRSLIRSIILKHTKIWDLRNIMWGLK